MIYFLFAQLFYLDVPVESRLKESVNEDGSRLNMKVQVITYRAVTGSEKLGNIE